MHGGEYLARKAQRQACLSLALAALSLFILALS